MVTLAKAFIVGASLTGLMVNTNELLDDSEPSLTETFDRARPKGTRDRSNGQSAIVAGASKNNIAVGDKVRIGRSGRGEPANQPVFPRSLIVKELVATLSSLVVRWEC